MADSFPVLPAFFRTPGSLEVKRAEHYAGLRRFLNAVMSSTLFRHTVTVGAGTTVSQVLPVIVLPWLTRLYEPAAYGVFGVFFSVVMVLSVIASGRYEMGIPVVDTDGEAAGLFLSSLIVLLGVSSLLVVAGASVWLILGTGYPSWPLWLGGLFVLSSGTLQSFTSWLIRYQRFRLLAVLRVTMATVGAVTSIALGYFTESAWGLAAGATAGQLIAAVLAAMLISPKIIEAWRGRDGTSLRTLLKRHRQLPLVNAPHALIDGMREAGFQVAFAAGFGAVANGMYALAVRALRMPTATIGSAVGQVLFGRFSHDKRELINLRPLILRVAGVLGLASAPFFLAIALFGPTLFSFVFGAEWSEAGQYARIMAPGLWATFVVAPLATLPLVTARMGGALGFAVIDLVMRAAAIGVGLLLGSTAIALIGLSAGSSVLAVVLLFWYLRIADCGRAKRVVFMGQSRWAKLLEEQLTSDCATAEETRYASVPIDSVLGSLRLANLRTLLRADAVVLVGFRPAAETLRGRVFDFVWRLFRVVRPSVRHAVYWMGTDVLRTREMLVAGKNQANFRRMVAGALHLAGSPNLVTGLRELGVNARLAAFPGFTLQIPDSPPPLPSEFRVLTYVPDARPDFYGGPEFIALARALPSVKVRIVGGCGSWVTDKPANVEFAGWVDDMVEQYSQAVVVARLVQHDGQGITAGEGLLFGRRVIYSGELENSIHVAYGDAEGLIEVVSALLKEFEAGNMAPDAATAAWAAEAFSQTRRVEVLRRIVSEMLG